MDHIIKFIPNTPEAIAEATAKGGTIVDRSELDPNVSYVTVGDITSIFTDVTLVAVAFRISIKAIAGVVKEAGNAIEESKKTIEKARALVQPIAPPKRKAITIAKGSKGGAPKGPGKK